MVTSYFASVNNQCLANKISKEGCQLLLDKKSIPNHIIIDLDHPTAPKSTLPNKCDYIFASDGSGNISPWNEPWILPIELKSSDDSITKIEAQLKSGTAILQRLIPPNTTVKFRPIVALGRGLHRSKEKQLSRTKIKFHGNSHAIERINCGDPLSKALRKVLR